MSTLTFFPISWFEDAKWKSIQVIGRLENGRSLFLRIGFRPYFTVKYTTNLDQIEDHHAYLISETPITEVIKLSSDTYRIYLEDMDDYREAVKFYKENSEGTITDEDQEIKSKFFAERRLSPGAWQRAINLQTLVFNVSEGSRYTSCDLEYYTNYIETVSHKAELPTGVNVFYDIEAIPSDDVHFPDAAEERPPDTVFAISLIVGKQNVIYVLTDQPIPQRYLTSTDPSYEVIVIRSSTEKELLENFFRGLADVRPDRMVTMNGRHFDINYIGQRVRLLNVEITPFTKLLRFTPYFREVTLIQRKPFPSRDRVLTLVTPGICQIDLLDYYRRTLPQLGNHRLETLGRVILGRGKTGLGIRELFARYRSGTVEDLSVIIDYSIIDSILLSDLWNKSQIVVRLAEMANFWKNDSEYVLTNETNSLFDDLFGYFFPGVISENYVVGRVPETERKQGIHRNVYLYSLSQIYLGILDQSDNSQTAKFFVDYFRGSDDGIVLFQSRYFPVTFKQVEEYVRTQVPADKLVWLEENSVAVEGTGRGVNPVASMTVTNYVPLIIVYQKSWILVDVTGLIFKKGLSAFVRPPFPLIEKYIDYLVKYLIENPDARASSVVFPQLPFNLNDFVLESKVKAEDLVMIPKKKEVIIQQLKELGLPIGPTWRKVKYIQTKTGPVIEEIYSKNPDGYAQMLDNRFYNKKLQETVNPLLK